MNSEFQEKGFVYKKALFAPEEVGDIRGILTVFHKQWMQENQSFFLDGAINSSGITARRYLDQRSRLLLFNFISSQKLMSLIEEIIPLKPCFMNTQLFFNPYNAEQKNYWHRDPQYHLSIKEQKEAIKGPTVLHIRIALKDEPGLELIPGTHKRWDSKEELDVRLEKGNRRCFEDLPGATKVSLDACDVLLFSGNMIHRGLYGLDRLALDILVCDPAEHFVMFAEESCLPNNEEALKIDAPALFNNTVSLRKSGRAQTNVDDD
ncbi:MAG: ectoine hydroxylase-related dioxygenase (phytanoyl-CoA dioxygenase family) [Candidatus Azotimanducaceae bacterium]|jgi:ectoine hydroxylase-related dioxygenase (phytanoyl-CoA dioxygenase family)